jgi:hypothetical protein
MQQGGFAAAGLTHDQYKQIRPLNQVVQHLQTLLKGIKRIVKLCIRPGCKRVPSKTESLSVILILICLKHGLTQKGFYQYQSLN